MRRLASFFTRYGRYDECTPLAPYPEADYASVIVIAVDDIEPQIAAPHHVDNVAPVGKYAGMPRDPVCICSCTIRRIEDLRIAACSLMVGVTTGTWLVVYPASRSVLLQEIS